MVFYKECNAEEFGALQYRQKKDDDNLKKHIQSLNHKELNFTILNLGNMLQVCAMYFEIKQDNIESYLKLEKERLRISRMETIVKELNQSINLRFEFDEDIEIVLGLFIYEGQSYIAIDKMKFVSELGYHDSYPNI